MTDSTRLRGRTKAEWFSKVWSAKASGTGTAGTKWERKGWAEPVERCQGDLGKQPARSKGPDRRDEEVRRGPLSCTERSERTVSRQRTRKAFE